MKKNKIGLFFVFSVLLMSSCATNYEAEKTVLLSKQESTDLINTFDAGKEQAAIFKEEKPTEVKAPKKTETTKEKAKIAKETPKAPTPAVIQPVTAAPVVVPVVPATPPVAPVISNEYPEEFKAYDAKSKNAWDKFKPVFYQGEQSIMAVTYLGVTAGYITILSKEVTSLNGKDVFHFYARFKSSDSYRYFYWLDDRLDSYVEKATFLPMKYSLIQREKKQNVDDLQLFDFKKMTTYNWYKRVKEGSNKDEKAENKIPSLAQDSFSALQFVRGLPLNKGDMYEFPVITRGKFWILKVEVMGEETINVQDKDVKAIRIRAETNFPGVLKKSGDIVFWYGADNERKLLKFQAKVKIGSLYGELVEYKAGTKVN